jgi:hypothetical protein
MKVSNQVKTQSALSLKEKDRTSCTLCVVVSRADVGTMEKKEFSLPGTEPIRPLYCHILAGSSLPPVVRLSLVFDPIRSSLSVGIEVK